MSNENTNAFDLNAWLEDATQSMTNMEERALRYQRLLIHTPAQAAEAKRRARRSPEVVFRLVGDLLDDCQFPSWSPDCWWEEAEEFDRLATEAEIRDRLSEVNETIQEDIGRALDAPTVEEALRNAQEVLDRRREEEDAVLAEYGYRRCGPHGLDIEPAASAA